MKKKKPKNKKVKTDTTFEREMRDPKFKSAFEKEYQEFTLRKILGRKR